ncbi:MAG: extracellular solute-binding protein [Omnitrophica WOR_2 bacterium]
MSQPRLVFPPHCLSRFYKTIDLTAGVNYTRILRPPGKLRLILLAWLAFILTFTAACGGGKIPSTTSRPDPTGRPAATPTPTRITLPKTLTPSALPASTLGIPAQQLQGITLQFWYTWPEPARLQNQPDPMQALLDAFNRTNPYGLRVQATPFEDYDQLIQQVETERYKGLPDLVTAYSDQLAHLDRSSGLLVDLNPYVADRQWGLSSQDIQDFYPVFWGQDASGPQRLGIPLYRSMQVLFYNTSLAGQLGYHTPPNTPEQFHTQACDAARAAKSVKDSGGSGGWVINTDIPTMVSWLSAYGVSLNPETGKPLQFQGTPAQKAFAWLRDLFDQGCAWKSPNRYPSLDFAGRKALFVAGSITSIPYQEQAFSQENSPDEWTVIPFPSPDGHPAVDTYGPSLGVFKSTPQKQLAAWLLARWLVSPESQVQWVKSLGVLPVRLSAIQSLSDYAARRPQWRAALNLIPFATLEPADPSWKVVRWVISDASAQLFSASFNSSQVPALIKTFDQTIKELDVQIR